MSAEDRRISVRLEASLYDALTWLARSKGSIMEFFGAWGDLSAKESKAIEEAMESVDQPLNEALKRRRI